MINNIREIFILTTILVLFFEYIKFFNDTRLPNFFKYRQIRLPLLVYMLINIFIAIVSVFITGKSSLNDYDYPFNILFVSLVSGLIPSGIIVNTEFYISNHEINKIREMINKHRVIIITDIKKYESSEIRKIGSKIERLPLDKLKHECEGLNSSKFAEIDKKQFKEDRLRSLLALTIVTEDLTYAKSLLEDYIGNFK